MRLGTFSIHVWEAGEGVSTRLPFSDLHFTSSPLPHAPGVRGEQRPG